MPLQKWGKKLASNMVIIFPSPSGARKRAGLPNGAVAPRGLAGGGKVSGATARLESSSSIPSTSKGSSPARVESGKIGKITSYLKTINTSYLKDIGAYHSF